MIDLKRLVEQMIYDCNVDDIEQCYNLTDVIFLSKKHISKYFNRTNHYALDKQIQYITDDMIMWYIPYTKTFCIELSYCKSIRIKLTQSFTRIKLLQLVETLNFNNSILHLCHTGK